MERNRNIMGQCNLSESQMIDYIKQYGQQIFGQAKPQSELSFNISSSQDGNKTLNITAEKQKQLIRNTVRRSKSKRQYSIRWDSSAKKINTSTYDSIKFQKYAGPVKKLRILTQDTATARTIAKPKYRNNQQRSLEKKIEIMENQQLKIALQMKKHKEQNPKNKAYIEVTSKYNSIKPIMEGSYANFINKNIYSRMITQSDYHIKQKYRNRSKQQRQLSWTKFLSKQKQWLKQKNMNLRNKQLEKLSIEKKQLNHSFKIVQPQPPTIQQSIRRLKRKTENLKEKLLNNSFKPILYTDRRDLHKMNKIIKKSKSKSKSKSKQKIYPNVTLNLKKNYETLVAIRNQNQLAFLAGK